MNPNIYKIKIDTILELRNEHFTVSTTDINSHKLDIEITQNKEVYDLTGLSVNIHFLKPDGKLNEQEATIDNAIEGKATCILETNSINRQGRVRAEALISKDGDLLTTKRFEFYATNPLASDKIIESTTELPILNKLITKVESMIQTQMEMVQAEDVRQDNEQLRITLHSELLSLKTILEGLKTTLEDTNTYVEDKKPFHFNHAAQEYLNIGRFWDSFKNGKIYTTEFYHSETSPSSSGVKKGDNEGLICEPSTNTVRGRNDYENVGLFMSIDVNAYVDESGDYHVIAIKGDGKFKNDGTMGDVYVMAMPGYQKRYSDDVVWGISYSDTMHAGYEILDESVKPDGTIRPYLLHAKYVAGRNPLENNNLASISGAPAEYVNMSHNGQITEFAKKGVQYSGKTSHDDYYVHLMMWLKYATTNSDTIMKGCQSYYLQYVNLVAETGVKRVIITNAQANSLLVGSTVSIGDYEGSTETGDRQQVRNYNKANRVNILSIEDLGNGNSVVNVDSSNAFDITLTTTITTYPWNSGGCDNVLGQDGSPYSNTSGKEPFIINGIEMIVGGYEVLQNLIIHNNNIDNRIDVYANYDCKTYATSPNANYDLVGQLVQTNDTWKYGSKMVVPKNHPSVILVTEADASSTLGTGDGIYTNAASVGGYRVWLSLGFLRRGAVCGLRCLLAYYALSTANWDTLGRLSATGRSRRDMQEDG